MESWDQTSGHGENRQRTCENICSYLRRGELRTAKRQRSRPVKRARGPNSPGDGMFQAEEDGGVGLQQEAA